MRRHESVAVSHTSNPPPTYLVPPRPGCTPTWGMCRGMRGGAASAPPPFPPPDPAPHLPTQPVCRSPCRPSALPSRCPTLAARPTAAALRTLQRCKILDVRSTSSACLQPDALEEDGIGSAVELTMLPMPVGAMSSSTKSSEDSRTVAKAQQASAQIGNVVRRGQRGAGAHF